MRFYLRVFLTAALCLCLWRSEAGAEWMSMLPGNVLDGKVIGIAADTYVLNIGLSNGVREGAHYLVYYDDADIVDVNGVVIGKYKIPIAVITARAVSMTESLCTMERPSDGWLIMEGDRVMLVNESSSDSMKFATLYGNPPKPDSFHAGRWKRVGPITNPAGMIAHYYHKWRLAGSDPFAAPKEPGFYYWKTGAVAIVPSSAYPPPHSGIIMPPASETPPAPPLPVPALAPASAPQSPPAPPVTPQPVQAPPVMTRQPVPALPTPPVPAPQPQQVPAAPPDPNRVTDSRIIQYLPLTDAERYSFEIQHRQARDFYQSRRYRDAMMKFAEMSASYPMDYLSPYWAGMCALSLNDGDTAARWFGFSLQKNPAYQPARDELSRMGRL